MATSTRARIAGILSLCLLVLSSFSATGALAGAAPPPVLIVQPLGPPPASSCQGTDACLGATGNIGNNSCNYEHACEGMSGTIGDNSCSGLYACYGMSGGIGDNSCNETYSCFGLGVAVGNNSCFGDYACYGVSGNIGNNSCNGAVACYEADARIGNFSCNGGAKCHYRANPVGDCKRNTVTPAECAQPDARIRRIGKHNMVGNDIYNSDGTNQTLGDTLGDRAVRFVITIQNDSDTASSFTIGSSNGVTLILLPPANFYHDWPAQDITAAVMAGTYTTPTIAPGGVYRIRAVVRPLQINFNHLTAGPRVPHYSWLVTATTVGNPTKVDAVRFEVDVPFS